MKNISVNLRMGFLLDVRRIFWRRISGNKLNFAFENLLQPIIVAFVVAFAYLGRGQYVDSYRDSFLYFTSLYSFWIGMFGSCQSINREVQSGEWSYWVLGFRRNRYFHIAAILFVNLFFAIVQSLFFIFAFSLILAGDLLISGKMICDFIGFFVSDVSGEFSPLFQMGGAMFPWLASGSSCYPFVFALTIFTITQLLAVLSGTGFGLMLGALFKDSVVSLNVSVGFVVLLGMLSLCGLRANGENDVDVSNAFLPEFERGTVLRIADESEDGEKEFSKVSLMIALGKILPQRYFFNFARLTANRDLDKKAYGSIVKEWRTRFGISDNTNAPPWLFLGLSDVYRSPESVRSRSGVRYWLKQNVPDDDDPRTYLRRYFSEHPDATKRLRIDIWFKMFCYAALKEIIPVIIIFLACITATMFLVKIKKGCYESLR